MNEPSVHSVFSKFAIFILGTLHWCFVSCVLVNFLNLSVKFLGHGLFINVEAHQEEIFALILIDGLILSLIVLFPNLVSDVLNDMFCFTVGLVSLQSFGNLFSFFIWLSYEGS